ncbi:hypothetical protein K1T71_010227 [Dendrolimus kikuchii]|uniref:Uncharacterized protein n=1 Tax=Dendrolimus kikuchii TaxID=765133 RepID=A0ACC1CRC4_9NEOP|nr:hypothetical protein K1T71_010227 [Dendrolimus kikuchii]
MCIFCVSLIILESIAAVDREVLDPALFLEPIPPMLPTRYTVSPQERWVSKSNTQHKPKTLADAKSYDSGEVMENAETFWPSLRATYHGVRTVPLSFSASGAYGGYSDNSPGVVATSYMGMASGNPDIIKYKNTGLAGSAYGTYGTDQSGIKIFNAGVKSGWSGWGNGKWGHYGKG